MTATRIGMPGQLLADGQATAFVERSLAGADLYGRSVCLIVPDGTRTCPLPLLLRAVHQALEGRVSRLTVLVALGTHAAMPERDLAEHLGGYPGRQHEWWDPRTFVDLGTIPAERVAQLSEGRLRLPVPVRVNRAVLEHDVVILLGPVFPHEAVGFSGGNKYLFPGVSGPEVIDLSHWLGALITSRYLIGRPGTTPVRALIDDAAALIPTRTLALCLVVGSGSGDLHALTFGDPVAAWRSAAEMSARVHIRYLDAPVRRVLAVLPDRYRDMWTAAKGFYKVEPIVADGGEVILYAPHVTRLATTHPEIERIGYHCRDYFTKQWDRFARLPWGVLAHSTHLRGAGTFDERLGERCRVTVTLATGIPENVVRSVNLNYLDPRLVDTSAEEFVVPHAGEILYRMSSSPPVDTRQNGL